jgi:hypothetical protein
MGGSGLEVGVLPLTKASALGQLQTNRQARFCVMRNGGNTPVSTSRHTSDRSGNVFLAIFDGLDLSCYRVHHVDDRLDFEFEGREDARDIMDGRAATSTASTCWKPGNMRRYPGEHRILVNTVKISATSPWSSRSVHWEPGQQ